PGYRGRGPPTRARVPRTLSARAVRGPAPTGRDRPGDCLEPQGDHCRRAGLDARCLDSRRRDEPHAGPANQISDAVRVHHARHRRGTVHVGSDRGDVSLPDRRGCADRRADRPSDPPLYAGAPLRGPGAGCNRRGLRSGIVIRIGFLASHEWRFEIPFVVAIGFLLVFMGLSVANFVSVAQVHGSAGVEATASVGYLRLASNGTLSDNGTARARINVTAVNPSSRSLQFDTVIYKLWIEDLPREAGFTVGRTDVPVQNGT